MFFAGDRGGHEADSTMLISRWTGANINIVESVFWTKPPVAMLRPLGGPKTCRSGEPSLHISDHDNIKNIVVKKDTELANSTFGVVLHNNCTWSIQQEYQWVCLISQMKNSSHSGPPCHVLGDAYYNGAYDFCLDKAPCTGGVGGRYPDVFGQKCK